MICVAPALRSRQSEASLCRMVSQSSLGNLSEIHCLERPRLWLWILVCWLVRGVSVSYFSVPLFLFLWHEVNRRAHIRGKSKWTLLCDTLPAALFWGEKQWIRSFHSFYVIIIIIAVFNDNWPGHEIRQLIEYYVGKWDQKNWPLGPLQAQPGPLAFFLHTIWVSLSLPVCSHNNFLKLPTCLQIKAIAVMAAVQAKAGKTEERQAPLIQPHTAYLSPFWKPVTQM